jgi:hypothetical protein
MPNKTRIIDGVNISILLSILSIFFPLIAFNLYFLVLLLFLGLRIIYNVVVYDLLRVSSKQFSE